MHHLLDSKLENSKKKKNTILFRSYRSSWMLAHLLWNMEHSAALIRCSICVVFVLNCVSNKVTPAISNPDFIQGFIQDMLTNVILGSLNKGISWFLDNQETIHIIREEFCIKEVARNLSRAECSLHVGFSSLFSFLYD